MSKVSLTNLVNLQNETTAVNAINANNAALTAAIENTLSRDGTAPNQMQSTLDMNSNRIINLPTAISVTEPVTLAQMTAALVANGNINTGLTGVPVSSAMQPVVNASTIPAAVALLNLSIRTRLVADTTFYVSPTGVDIGSGTSVGSPWQHINYAIQTICTTYDLSGFNCTIQLANGVYQESVTCAPYVGRGTQGHTGPIVIQGNVSNPALVTIAPTSGGCITCVETGPEWIFQHLTLTSPVGFTGASVLADARGWVVINDVIFSASTSGVHMQAEYGGIVEIVGNYTIAGGTLIHLLSTTGGIITYTGGQTISITGTPAFTAQFASSQNNGLIIAVAVTFSGAATGPRFAVLNGGGIMTQTGNVNYFPGNSAGTVTSPGWYS